MAILKIVNQNYETAENMINVTGYVGSPGKACATGLSGLYMTPENYAEDICGQMMLIKDLYGKNGGKQLVHFILSLSSYEGDLESGVSVAELESVSNLVSVEIENMGYQNFYGIHDSRYKSGQLHVHFLMNTVNFSTGEKFSGKVNEYEKIAGLFQFYLYLRGYPVYINIFYGKKEPA